MNGIIAMGDALSDEDLSSDQKQKVEILTQSAKSLLHLLNDLLDNAKLSENKLEICPAPHSPRQILQDLSDVWQQSARDKGLELRLALHPHIPDYVQMDGFRFRQVMTNLVSNAVKFTKNGHIEVSSIFKPDDTGLSGRLLVGVKDTGIGMTKDALEQLFDPYIQADATIGTSYGGTGLGMTISRQLVELMGGTIKARSTFGEGTQIVVALPCDVALEATVLSAPEPSIHESSIQPGGLSHLTVLVADDIDVNLTIMEVLLKPYGPRIVTVKNGEEVLEKLKTEPCDLILMDVHMPEMDGIEATLKIRHGSDPWSQIPILALTADADPQMHRTCINIGMDASLTKPVALNTLLDELANLIDMGRLAGN